jgi:hypothetical protein
VFSRPESLRLLPWGLTALDGVPSSLFEPLKRKTTMEALGFQQSSSVLEFKVLGDLRAGRLPRL